MPSSPHVPMPAALPFPISFLIFLLMLILLGKCFSITGTMGGMGRWLGGTGAAVSHYGAVRAPCRAFGGVVCGVGLGVFMGDPHSWSSQGPHQTGELHPALSVHDPVQHRPHHPAQLQGLGETPTPTSICAVWRGYVGIWGHILGCRGSSLTIERYFRGGGVSSLTPIRCFIIVRFR